MTDTGSARFDGLAFGLACGLLWSAGVAALGLLSRVGYGRRWRQLLSDAYRGYDESATGLVVGAAWAFADGFLGGAAFAALYNRLRDRRAG